MRMFPESNSSQTIIDCFLSSAHQAGVEILLNQNVGLIEKEKNHYIVHTKNEKHQADSIVIASGGNKQIWDLIKQLGHHIIDPVPSLFTFNIKSPLLADIPGTSVPKALVSMKMGYTKPKDHC